MIKAINLGELRYQILGKDGVIGIKELKLFQSTAEIDGFNSNSSTNRELFTFNNEGSSNGNVGFGWAYSFQNAVQNDIIRPSATPQFLNYEIQIQISTGG